MNKCTIFSSNFEEMKGEQIKQNIPSHHRFSLWWARQLSSRTRIDLYLKPMGAAMHYYNNEFNSSI